MNILKNNLIYTFTIWVITLLALTLVKITRCFVMDFANRTTIYYNPCLASGDFTWALNPVQLRIPG